MRKSEEEMDLGGNLELSFGHAKVEVPMKHPMKMTNKYTYESLELSGEIRVGDTDLRIIGT